MVVNPELQMMRKYRWGYIHQPLLAVVFRRFNEVGYCNDPCLTKFLYDQ
jgi:hypothetical protein